MQFFAKLLQLDPEYRAAFSKTHSFVQFLKYVFQKLGLKTKLQTAQMVKTSGRIQQLLHQHLQQQVRFT